MEDEWIIAPPHPDRERLSREARIDPLLAQILLNREVRTAVEVREFLAPDLNALLPPRQLPNAVAAGKRLADAARTRRRIVIYGDYDVDGVTATAILWHGLKLADANVDFYIPSRFDEGYGVNGEALEQIRASGADIVVTVDCGITALEEARLARKLGLELIVTDHHEPQADLPDASVVVHPTACGKASANPHLSGAGVAFKVAWALAQEVCGATRVTPAYREHLVDATAFAALGLVADVVPLVGENRVIASFGLRHLCHTQNPGLRALIEVSGLASRKSYDDYDVGFILAPRLNAVGRLGHARLAVELFTQAASEQAYEIATALDAQNRERRRVEREIVKQAAEMAIARGFDRESRRGIVLASSDWHPGVVGIVASRMVDRFHRPTVLIALGGSEGQGSGRSIRHFPLHQVLAACEQHLISHGGHAMAAGIRIAPDQVAAFTDAFLAQAAQRLTPADLVPKLRLDDEVGLGQMVPELVDQIQRLAPFGIGNPRPGLATRAVELVDEPRAVGQGGQHLQFTVRQERTYRKAIAFGRGDRLEELADHRRLRLAFEPIINEWSGRRSVELKVIDWKF
ncbi:MAG: single-stranded-DNA-specific exonuclease RecJ [Phycisphaerae bacterium]